MRRSVAISLLCTLWFSIGSTDRAARASGFQDRTGSPDWLATAFAGLAAQPYGASTSWSNPAAMTLLNQNVLDLNGSLIVPSTRPSTVNTVAGRPVLGTDGGNAGETAFVPGTATVWNVSSDFKIGGSLESPFGQRLSYPTDFVGRYQALTSSVTDLELGLAAAYRINKYLSIGGGLIVDYFAARLTSAINTGPTSALTGDPTADVHGTSFSGGYHFGLLVQPTAETRIGVDYRSRIKQTIDGTQEIGIPPALAILSPATASLLNRGNGPAHTSVTLPDILTLSGAWDITPEWTALITAQWTDWALLQKFTISTAGGSTTLPIQFHSTWLGSAGVNYRPAWAPAVKLQAGVGFDQSPAKNSNRTPRLPGSDGVLLSVGASYAATPSLKLQAAYLHIFGVGSNGIAFSSSPSAGTLTGSYSNHADVISAGMVWSF
jgi:long-chain fatty acid transport protein